nr:LysE family translocator [Alphaproteobacteria bacterium]
MPIQEIIGYFVFISILIATPGPANMLFLSHGAQYGFRRTIPVLGGTMTGYMLVMLGGGVGLLQVLERVPTVQYALWGGSVAYILFLSWRIYSAPVQQLPAGGQGAEGPAKDRALRWYNGLIVHPLNPKAWLMAITSYAQFYQVERGFAN